jgi:hydrogenase maturation protein HypF
MVTNHEYQGRQYRLQKRLKLLIAGIVQGVGFRPFIFRLATRHGLTGFVRNLAQGVLVEAQGSRIALRRFVAGLKTDRLPHVAVHGVKWETRPVVAGESSFAILPSEPDGSISVCLPPDLTTCDQCLSEIFNPEDRRYQYPFTNCTQCGPRYTIVKSLPYDRPATTMSGFKMCPACQDEYDRATDRRFHAQPNACPICGPKLQIRSSRGTQPPDDGNPLDIAREALRNGRVLLLKGLGGFHLTGDATNDDTVLRIRALKSREAKPLALLCRDPEQIQEFCSVSAEETALLKAVSRPIVILRRLRETSVKLSPRIAPGQDSLGVMLPYTPLHHLLMAELPFPLIVTSANRGDEPIPRDETEIAAEILNGADLILTHDRPIRTRCDDSVAIARPRTILIRRSRGYAPQPVKVAATGETLGIGADYKNTACFLRDDMAYFTQHIGNMDNDDSVGAARQSIANLRELFGFEPRLVGCDLHPGYKSREFAYTLGLPVAEFQHHFAHIASCMAENRVSGEVVGVAFDGTGYGTDGTVWGGEFLQAGYDGFQRNASLRPVGMAGGERAVREPWRMAIAYLHDAFGSRLPDFPGADSLYDCGASLLVPLLEQGLNTQVTTSAGRLFDAIAAIVGLSRIVSYEGEAAMSLESRAHLADPLTVQPYGMDISQEYPLRIDLRRMVRDIVADLRRGVKTPEIAAAFHLTMAEAITATCREIRLQTGTGRVALSGGVFQNALLLDTTIRLLQRADFEVYYHRLLPPNDGGIALGQAILASRLLKQATVRCTIDNV